MGGCRWVKGHEVGTPKLRAPKGMSQAQAGHGVGWPQMGFGEVQAHGGVGGGDRGLRVPCTGQCLHGGYGIGEEK